MRIKNKLEQIIDKVKNINKIEFTKDFDAYLQGYNLIHYEEELFERIGIGYNVMLGEFNKVLKVRLTQELREIIEQGVMERRSVKMDSEINQVVYILRDYGGQMTTSEMIFELANFGVDSRAAYKLLNSAKSTGRITIQGNIISSRWMRSTDK